MANDIASLGVKVTPTGIKETTQQLAQLQEQGEKTERSAKDLAITAGKVLGGAILGGAALAAVGLKKYVSGTIEAERVQAQLAARIKSTGGAAGLAIADFNKMADALQRATTYDDESIGDAQALLLTFTKIGKDVFPRATEAVLDMSTALGGDLKGAALQVGKALNDPVQGVTALARAGVQFSDAQKETIKQLVETGKQAEAQAIVLKELETQMGGAARAARNTLGGALEGLKNTFDNLLEGDSGSEGVRGTREAIESLTDTLNDPAIKSGIDSTAQGLLKLVNVSVQLIAKLGEAGSALKEYFADASEKGDASLQNRINELETEVFQIERSNRNSLPIFRRDTSDQKAEIAELEGILSARNRASMFADVTSKVDSTEFAKAGGGGSSDGPRKRTAAVKELSEEQKKINDLEEVYALLVEQSAGATRELFFERQRAGEEAAAEVQRRLENNKALIADMQSELDLMRMSTVEREQAIASRQLEAGATDEQKRAVAGLAEELARTHEQIGLMDQFRGTLSDTFADVITGAASAKDAFKSFVDSIIDQMARALANQAVQQLFGDFGTASTGSSGGWMATLADAIFGGGWGGVAKGGAFGGGAQLFAKGGVVDSPQLFTHGGRLGLMGEAGPEAIVPLHRGPDGKLGIRMANGGQGSQPSSGRNVTNYTTFVLPNRYTPQTQAQIAQQAQRVQSRETGRNS